MTTPTAYLARDGQQYVRLRTTIAETLDLGYISYLGACHESFAADMTPTAFRRLVVERFGQCGTRGDEAWMDHLDEIDPVRYAAATALAVRAYDFDMPTSTTEA